MMAEAAVHIINLGVKQSSVFLVLLMDCVLCWLWRLYKLSRLFSNV